MSFWLIQKEDCFTQWRRSKEHDLSNKVLYNGEKKIKPQSFFLLTKKTVVALFFFFPLCSTLFNALCSWNNLLSSTKQSFSTLFKPNQAALPPGIRQIKTWKKKNIHIHQIKNLLPKATTWTQWICIGSRFEHLNFTFNESEGYIIILVLWDFIEYYADYTSIFPIHRSREKFRNVVFIYVSDDLEWGRQMVGRKARNRHLDIYFVGDANKIDDRDRDRDRYVDFLVLRQGYVFDITAERNIICY